MLSIMWNPFFEGKSKTLEVFIRSPIERDLYTEMIKIEIIGFLRTSANFLTFSDLL